MFFEILEFSTSTKREEIVQHFPEHKHAKRCKSSSDNESNLLKTTSSILTAPSFETISVIISLFYYNFFFPIASDFLQLRVIISKLLNPSQCHTSLVFRVSKDTINVTGKIKLQQPSTCQNTSSSICRPLHMVWTRFQYEFSRLLNILSRISLEMHVFVD